LIKLIGVNHLPPLPNSPGYSSRESHDYIDYALSEADKLYSAGFHGIIIENYMDYPYSIRVFSRESLNALGGVVRAVKSAYSDLLVGVNVLRNSGVEAAEIACKYGGDFIRVNAYLEPVYSPEGILYPTARAIWDYLGKSKCRIKIYADVNVKHSKPILSFIESTYNTCKRGRVDGVIITGWATGYETPISRVYAAKCLCREKEVWVGSGVSEDNIGGYVEVADAIIIGTSIKIDRVTHNPIDYDKAYRVAKRLEGIDNRVKRQYLNREQ